MPCQPPCQLTTKLMKTGDLPTTLVRLKGVYSFSKEKCSQVKFKLHVKSFSSALHVVDAFQTPTWTSERQFKFQSC